MILLKTSIKQRSDIMDRGCLIAIPAAPVMAKKINTMIAKATLIQLLLFSKALFVKDK